MAGLVKVSRECTYSVCGSLAQARMSVKGPRAVLRRALARRRTHGRGPLLSRWVVLSGTNADQARDDRSAVIGLARFRTPAAGRPRIPDQIRSDRFIDRESVRTPLHLSSGHLDAADKR